MAVEDTQYIISINITTSTTQINLTEIRYYFCVASIGVCICIGQLICMMSSLLFVHGDIQSIFFSHMDTMMIVCVTEIFVSAFWLLLLLLVAVSDRLFWPW